MGSEPSPAAPSSASVTGLSRERILGAALELADSHGIAALSMRGLSQRLGVGTMTLYHYVADKDELLAGIVDLAVGEIELSRDRRGWKGALRRTGLSAHRALQRHPWAAGLLFVAGDGPARLRYMEHVLGTLRQAGFSAEVAHHAFHALDSHIVGFTLWESSIPFDADELRSEAVAAIEEQRFEAFPYVVEHIEQHLREPPGAGSERAFVFGLDLLLDALDARR